VRATRFSQDNPGIFAARIFHRMSRVTRMKCYPLCFVCAVAGTLSVAAAEPPAELQRWFQPQPWQRDVDGPIVSPGNSGDFDDMHIFAPAVAHEQDRFLLWYSGSRGTPSQRVFRLGLANSLDGKRFEKHAGNPVLQFNDAAHSILTPALLRNADGSVLRENEKLRLWFSSTAFGKTGLHTLHESTSADGVHWADPSPVLLESAYCPSVLKTAQGYQMWFSDVSKRPWVIRHAASADGSKWTVTERPALQLSQDWEAEVLVYPTVLQSDGAYLMWYGSYDKAVRRQTTAIGFAASLDGVKWHKHPQNPVFRPDPRRAWESNYVGSGCVMRLADGSFRYWYASRTRPPFVHLYFALNTARWAGPVATLPLPPAKGDVGIFAVVVGAAACRGRSIDVLEVIDGENAIVRAWYTPAVERSGDSANESEVTFVDLWVRGINTTKLTVGAPALLPQTFRATGSKTFDTTCGQRSLPLLEPMDGSESQQK
jgi:hypothetical protein